MTHNKNNKDSKPSVSEVLIKGKKVKFDGCSDNPLEKALLFFTPDRWEHLGEGKECFRDGQPYDYKTTHQFFKLK